MNVLNELMNWISISLLLPVVVLLLIGFLAALATLGGFCSFYLGVLRRRRGRVELMRKIRSGRLSAADLEGAGAFRRALRAMEKLNWDELHCEKFLADRHAAQIAELDRLRFLIKIGPMLGLMGTLIPMGPALAGLASGDIGSMAYNMQLAFATTVIGVTIAGVDMLVLNVKKHFYEAEHSDLCYALDLQLRERRP